MNFFEIAPYKNLSLLLLATLLSSCAIAPQKYQSIKDKVEPILFSLQFDGSFPKENFVNIAITVPNSVRSFEAPKDYGGAPLFTRYIKNVTATDSNGKFLTVQIQDNIISVAASESAVYTLKYIYDVPQKISGEIDQSLPNLNSTYGRFDNNMLFLVPKGLNDQPAELSISPPNNWKVVTGWGEGTLFSVPKVSQLVSGMIVLGDYDYSEKLIGEMNVIFAIKGDLPHEVLKDQFAKVLKSQQDIAGVLPDKKFLVVFQPTVRGCCKGTALTNSLNVNIPRGEKLEPFNFSLIGTTSHELFHQWNFKYVYPASDEGAYLFSEGFTNYFAVAALVKANLIPPESFAWFLWHYRNLLENNPEYPAADFQKIQSGFKNDSSNSNLVDLAYTKGPFVAVLLDLGLRDDTIGKESLVTWFRMLTQRFGGKKGYTIDDLRNLLIELSGKPNGHAVRAFDYAFLGNKKIDTKALFKRLGIACVDKTKKCTLSTVVDSKTRQKLFSATP